MENEIKINTGPHYRVAVCLSGQSRTWERAAKNIKWFFNNNLTILGSRNIDVDYFFHSWDVNHWRDHSFEPHPGIKEKHNQENDIVTEYSPKAYMFENFDQKKFPRAWDPLFYSHHQSLMLKRGFEIDQDFEYDFVFKARFDVIYSPNITLHIHDLTPGCCYTPSLSKFPREFNYNNFDDVMFYGDSKTMDMVGDLYFSYKFIHTPREIAKDEKHPSVFYGPGCLLYEHITDLGFLPRTTECGYSVLRRLFPSSLDTIDDYDELHELGVKWYAK